MDKVIEVSVVGLVMDPVSKSPVMILEPLNEKRPIPIWIGIHEANAIALELENIISPRPMTHDLIKNIMNVLEARVEKVIITDLIESTYYAELYIHRGGEVQIIDCRPSDAIAVALKNKAKIFVSEQVIEASPDRRFFLQPARQRRENRLLVQQPDPRRFRQGRAVIASTPFSIVARGFPFPRGSLRGSPFPLFSVLPR